MRQRRTEPGLRDNAQRLFNRALGWIYLARGNKIGLPTFSRQTWLCSPSPMDLSFVHQFTKHLYTRRGHEGTERVAG